MDIQLNNMLGKYITAFLGLREQLSWQNTCLVFEALTLPLHHIGAPWTEPSAMDLGLGLSLQKAVISGVEEMT